MMAAIRYFGYRSEVYKDILNKFYALLLFILLIPAMKVCMEQLDCVYRDPSVPYVYLQNNPSIQCFHGLHILNTVIAVIFIFGMYAAALIYIVYIRKNISDFIRFNATFEIVLLAVRFALFRSAAADCCCRARRCSTLSTYSLAASVMVSCSSLSSCSSCSCSFRPTFGCSRAEAREPSPTACVPACTSRACTAAAAPLRPSSSTRYGSPCHVTLAAAH